MNITKILYIRQNIIFGVILIEKAPKNVNYFHKNVAEPYFNSLYFVSNLNILNTYFGSGSFFLIAAL